MQEKDVPQDKGLFGEMREVCYAVDEQGRYVLAETAGWEPANLANVQAWEAIRSELEKVLARVRRGEASPLVYHMAARQMDEKLLAQYTGFFRWQVRRHMKPGPFSRLAPAKLRRYATLFRIGIDELTAVPERPEGPVSASCRE